MLSKVLELLWDEVSAHGEPDAPWSHVLKPNRPGISAKALDSAIVDRIQSLSNVIQPWLLPDFPVENGATIKGSKRQLLAAAETVWTYLVLQRLANLKGEVGFFLDSQSLLFLIALEEVLPALNKSGEKKAHNLLLRAMALFTLNFFKDQEAHYHYLQSLLMDNAGELAQKQKHLYQALSLTSCHDHSYLTKAQAYCDSLMEEGKAGRALEFLIDLHGRHPEGKTEIQEMILAISPAAAARGVLKR